MLMQYRKNCINHVNGYKCVEHFNSDHLLGLLKTNLLLFFRNHRTVKSHYYSRVLQHKVQLAFRNKRQGLSTKAVILQHDNVRFRTDQLTYVELQDLGSEVLLHPMYSTELAQSHFQIFDHSKTPDMEKDLLTMRSQVSGAKVISGPRGLFHNGVKGQVPEWLGYICSKMVEILYELISPFELKPVISLLFERPS